MKEKSLTFNAFMHLSNQLSSVLFPLITFPYVSRILQPEGLGKINFAQAIVSCFILVAALGIPTYGTREVAKARDDKQRISQLVVELFLFTIITTTAILIFFLIFVSYSEKASSEPTLFWICIMPMLLFPIDFNFLFEGKEEFTYIAIRSIIFRTINICAIFIFVKTRNDYTVFALINSLNYAGSCLVNLSFARKQTNIKKISWKNITLLKHLKPAFTIFLFSAIISIYTSFDKIMLGYLSCNEQVGFYTVSDRIVKTIIVTITAFSTVVTPRVMNYIENKRYKEFQIITKLSLNTVLFFSFPCALGLFVLAQPLVFLFGGSSYTFSTTLIQIMSLNVIFISLSNFIGFQILYANNKETILLYSVIIGAVSNFTLNLLLIPIMHSYGAAIATLISEIVVVFIQIIASRPINIFVWPLKEIATYFVSALIMAIVIYFLMVQYHSFLAQLAICIPVGAMIYFFGMYIMKDQILHNLLNKIKSTKV